MSHFLAAAIVICPAHRLVQKVVPQLRHISEDLYIIKHSPVRHLKKYRKCLTGDRLGCPLYSKHGIGKMRLHKKIPGVVSLLAMTASLPAFASNIDENGKTIQFVGSQNNGPSYVAFNEPLQVTCLFNTVYLPDPSSAYGKAMVAILLNAEATNRKVRVVYSQATDGTCTASLIAG